MLECFFSLILINSCWKFENDWSFDTKHVWNVVNCFRSDENVAQWIRLWPFTLWQHEGNDQYVLATEESIVCFGWTWQFIKITNRLLTFTMGPFNFPLVDGIHAFALCTLVTVTECNEYDTIDVGSNSTHYSTAYNVLVWFSHFSFWMRKKITNMLPEYRMHMHTYLNLAHFRMEMNKRAFQHSEMGSGFVPRKTLYNTMFRCKPKVIQNNSNQKTVLIRLKVPALR